MKIGKHYWYEKKVLWNKEHTIGLDVGMTIPLWLEGQYNELRHKYMVLRKKKKLNTSDKFWKLLKI